MMKVKPVIRATDYLPKPEEGDIGKMDSFELSQSDKMLISIFGDTPDYSHPEFEAFWQGILNADDKETIAYCLEKGVDVLAKDGNPVPGFRDIAVMLKAIDSGLLETENRKGDSVRKTFADTFKEIYTKTIEEKGSILTEQELRIKTMVTVAEEVRKDLNPELAASLKEEQFQKDYREYLSAEFKLFVFVPKEKTATVFAEYLLMSLMDVLDANEIIDFNFLEENINEAYTKANSGDKAYIDDLRRIYPWGSLIQ